MFTVHYRKSCVSGSYTTGIKTELNNAYAEFYKMNIIHDECWTQEWSDSFEAELNAGITSEHGYIGEACEY